MDRRRNIARRTDEESVNEAVPPQAPQNRQVPIEEGAMSNVEIRSAIHNLTQVLATQVARDARVKVFPLELRERKMQEFINLHQRDMSVKEYGLKFTKLCKHAPTLVSVSRATMNKFVMGVFDLVVNECRSDMLIPSMDISRLMVHAELIEEQNFNQVGRELKRSRADDGKSSKIRIEIQDKPKFKKKFSNQGPPNTAKVNKGKVSTPKPQEARGGGPSVEKPICTNCGRKHEGKCLVGTGNCYGCGKSGHMWRDCPILKAQGRENAQAQASGPNPNAPKKNHFYVLQSRGDQERSSNVVTGMLQINTFRFLPRWVIP
ncbi:uncharacterized protein LOC125814080 [Solanum verrucosum]|uniref:uncharacterized protein LOC125814080 n=1 Tax=Solanum verrucosum TaxID=315347 RepID=UPI0020D15CCF|nr:uncharacterized protein LOC125814080 [Solanum verrucosum]